MGYCPTRAPLSPLVLPPPTSLGIDGLHCIREKGRGRRPRGCHSSLCLSKEVPGILSMVPGDSP